MGTQRIDHVLTTVDHVEHTRRHTGFKRQLDQHQGRQRVLLRRLENECVTAGDGHGEHPQRNHGREVERRDPCAHTNGLTQGVGVDPARDVFSEFAHLQRADGARVLNHFQATKNIALGVCNGFALLGTEHGGDAFGVFTDQCLQLEHDAHARTDRRQLPGLEGTLSGLDGRVDFSCSGERDFGQHLLSGRVDDVLPLCGLRLDPLTVNQQAGVLIRGRSRHESLRNYSYGRGDGLVAGLFLEYRCAFF